MSKYSWKPPTHAWVLARLGAYYRGLFTAKEKAAFEKAVGEDVLECPCPEDDPNREYVLGYIGDLIVLLRSEHPGREVPMEVDPKFLAKFPKLAEILKT